MVSWIRVGAVLKTKEERELELKDQARFFVVGFQVDPQQIGRIIASQQNRLLAT